MESGGLDRRSNYLQTSSMAARTRGGHGWRLARMLVQWEQRSCTGSGVMVGVQGATTSLVMTRVKAPFLELGRSCCEGQRRSEEEAGCSHRGWSRVGIRGLGSK